MVIKIFKYISICCLVALLSLPAFGRDSKILAEVTQNHPSGIYKINENITWTIKPFNLSDELSKKVHYTVKRGGLELIEAGNLDLSKGAQTVSASLNDSGSFLLTLTAGKKKQRSGAVIDPKMIKPSMSKPKDFDTFWNAKLAEQNKIPMNQVLTREESTIPEVDSWVITLDTIRGQKIQGRLAKPKGEKKLPAILFFQYAGIYPLSPKGIQKNAKDGWLVLNISAHDQPINKNQEFYKELKQGKLSNYAAIGNTDREKSYFLRMNLACSRAVDYLASHPNWDGKNIVVSGGSQGGYQAIVAAGLNSKVTLVMANVPAGCDQTAPMAQRAISWPYWLRNDEKNKDKMNTARYFDAVNFAGNIKCPVLISFGLGDVTSRPEGIFAAINEMQGEVQMIVKPNQGHKGSYRKYYRGLVPEWKKKILEE